MAAPPKIQFQIHDAVEKKIREWDRDPATGRIFLAYGLAPYTWAELRCELYKISIPIPASPSPYKTWKEWLRDYLEDQIRLVSEETGIPVYLLTRKGQLIALNQKECIEKEVDL